MEGLDLDRVYIPLRESDQTLVLNSWKLPSDVYDVIEILRSEAAPREVWTKVGRLFNSASRLSDCIRILEDALRPEMEALLTSMESDGSRKVELLVSLAGAYILQGLEASEKETDYHHILEQAASVLNQAEALNVNNPLLWEAKAWKEFYNNDFDRARSFFETAASIGKTSAGGKLGMAALLLNFKESGASESLFRSTMLELHCPVSAWLGLAHAFLANGQLRNAEEAFERVLHQSAEEYRPEAIEALVNLATIKMNSEQDTGVQEALLLIKSALKKQHGAEVNLDPRLLSHASEIFYYGGDVQRAESLALSAAKIAGVRTSSETLSDIRLQLARIAHSRGNYLDAFRLYKQAEALQEQAGKDRLGSQVHLGCGLLGLALQQGEKDDYLIDHLQAVLKANDKCSRARRALGVVLAKTVLREGSLELSEAARDQRREMSKTMLQQGILEDGGEDDIPALITYAQLFELSRPEVAITSYKKAVEAYKRAGKDEPFELLNNLSALQASVTQFGEAKATLERSIQLVRKRNRLPDGSPLGPRYVTLSYNYARLFEKIGDVNAAQEMYSEITHLYPSYSDASIRLGYILLERGDLAGSEECAQKAVLSSSKSSRSLAASLLVMVRTKQRAYPSLQKILEMGSEKKLDMYAEVALASFWTENLYSMEPERRNRMLERIHRLLAKVVRENPSNAVAAAGIGCFLAMNHQYSDARDVFSSVAAHRYCGSNFKVNLAHVQVEIGKRSNRRTHGASKTVDSSSFQQAAKLYIDAMDKIPTAKSDSELLLYLARTIFEAEDYDEALRLTHKLLHLSPQYLPLWYNFAVVLQECSLAKMESNVKSVKQIKQGAAELDRAHRLFSRLRSYVPYEGSGPVHAKPTPQSTEAHYRFCKERLNKARVVLVNAEQTERTAQERLEQQKREVERRLAAEKAEREEAERKRLEEKEALEQRQRVLDEKLQQELVQKDQNEDGSGGGDPDMPYSQEESVLRSTKRRAVDSDEDEEDDEHE
eukprot:CAMPEP_0184739636 /NCGR_PEP_ID=MMETSP0315-20130426/2552_1 /TAXON_ID=101924 /ORGANISM="Rhodosorus marinus, Strain UTEX LB 2760" /LENGTH=999 /DNA_ID=CAMNT_0027208657 /DNA_START=250 /DNA_END=3246 /DNA_ORIENTATION=+